jgi:hypothetical protein
MLIFKILSLFYSFSQYLIFRSSLSMYLCLARYLHKKSQVIIFLLFFFPYNFIIVPVLSQREREISPEQQ